MSWRPIDRAIFTAIAGTRAEVIDLEQVVVRGHLTLGVLFGVARGVVIVAILVLLAGLTALPRDPWWGGSSLLPQFQQIALWIRGFLPPDIAAQIRY